jgi:hypothetical protein
MKRSAFGVLILAGTFLAIPCGWAQFPGITLPNGQGLGSIPTGQGTIPAGQALAPMPTGPGFPVSDVAAELNTDITATSETVGGMAGGFDPGLALAPDLQQQVSSTQGLPLDAGAISGRYPTLWPGYTNADYGQQYADGSPEGDMLTTLGTLQGTLQANADQQDSQAAELDRLETLELGNAAALGVFQLIEISNEAAIFEAEQEMKLRDSTNAQLNALVVAASEERNKQAQDDLAALGVTTETVEWDATNVPPGPDPQIPAPPPLRSTQ